MSNQKRKGRTVRLVLMEYQPPNEHMRKGRYIPIKGYGRSLVARTEAAIVRLWDTVANASDLWDVEQKMAELERKGAIAPADES